MAYKNLLIFISYLLLLGFFLIIVAFVGQIKQIIAGTGNVSNSIYGNYILYLNKTADNNTRVAISNGVFSAYLLSDTITALIIGVVMVIMLTLIWVWVLGFIDYNFMLRMITNWHELVKDPSFNPKFRCKNDRTKCILYDTTEMYNFYQCPNCYRRIQVLKSTIPKTPEERKEMRKNNIKPETKVIFEGDANA